MIKFLFRCWHQKIYKHNLYMRSWYSSLLKLLFPSSSSPLLTITLPGQTGSRRLGRLGGPWKRTELRRTILSQSGCGGAKNCFPSPSAFVAFAALSSPSAPSSANFTPSCWLLFSLQSNNSKRWCGIWRPNCASTDMRWWRNSAAGTAPPPTKSQPKRGPFSAAGVSSSSSYLEF